MLLGDLRRLAHETYLELNLGSLIRLDVRADADGKLHVLEANPKPDLKKPAAGVTSLIAAGLPELGMQYDDLILSLLADRLDFLFAHRRGMVEHLFDLLETPNLFDLMGSPESARAPQPDESMALPNDATADLNVLELNAALRAAWSRDEPADPSADLIDRVANIAGLKQVARAK